MKEVMRLRFKNHLFLTVIKLRHDFHCADIAFRFNISTQTTSVIFTNWINYMFLRYGELSIWPHRDVISANMPQKFKEEFPNTFGILDCTEIKINKPLSLKAQSQTYSDYTSCNTLKGLVACDPRGSITYASMLFSRGISDKDIFVQYKFKDMLCDLIDEGYLQQGDDLMADKGFNIEKEVEKCGLRLDIPPFATQLSLFTVINQLWYVCTMLIFPSLHSGQLINTGMCFVLNCTDIPETGNCVKIYQ